MQICKFLCSFILIAYELAKSIDFDDLINCGKVSHIFSSFNHV